MITLLLHAVEGPRGPRDGRRRGLSVRLDVKDGDVCIERRNAETDLTITSNLSAFEPNC